MPVHVIDSIFFKDLFGSSRMRAVFDDSMLLQKWLDFEAALARAEATMGLIPKDAADEITRKAQAQLMDTSKIKDGIDKTIHPLVSMIWQLSEICDGDAGKYVHWGATTQDVMDTALILQIKDAVVIFEETISELKIALIHMAKEYRNTPIAGRTHGQQALPTTFGYKVAVWLAELHRHTLRLNQAKHRVLVGEFGGAVGTLAGLNESEIDAMAIHSVVMEELDLNVPTIAWHTSRDGIAEFTHILCMVSALMGRIAKEIIELQKQEIGELEEPFEMGKVGSSTMPQKRNPMLCESILTLARLCREKSSTAIDTLIYNEHERDWASFQMEWAFIPEVCVMTQGALEMTLRVINGLHVHPKRMLRNMNITHGLLLSERVMFALGEYLGRQDAHDIVYACAMEAVESETRFVDILMKNSDVNVHLTRDELETLLDPTQYTGLAAQFVDQVIKEVESEP